MLWPKPDATPLLQEQLAVPFHLLALANTLILMSNVSTRHYLK
jgi:hypothetical protein